MEDSGAETRTEDNLSNCMESGQLTDSAGRTQLRPEQIWNSGGHRIRQKLQTETRGFVSNLVVSKYYLLNHHRNACAISDDKNQQVFITGGGAQEIVSVYGTSGWVKDIASLNIGRSEHGCAGYYSQEGLVRLRENQNIRVKILNNWQVLLVSGGHSDVCRDSEFCDRNGWLTSTEIHRLGETSWRQVAPLQHSLQKPVAVTLDNRIFLTGSLHYRVSIFIITKFLF